MNLPKKFTLALGQFSNVPRAAGNFRKFPSCAARPRENFRKFPAALGKFQKFPSGSGKFLGKLHFSGKFVKFPWEFYGDFWEEIPRFSGEFLKIPRCSGEFQMKFARNCVFFVDSPLEIFLAPRKIFGNSPRGLGPSGNFQKFSSWRGKFLGESPQKNAISYTNCPLSGQFIHELPAQRAIYSRIARSQGNS